MPASMREIPVLRGELAKRFLTKKAETERKVKESAERIMLKIKNQQIEN
ncbi:hypothetical protein [Anaeromusa acidaminophila]|nr:hypothetical protein [Anaeromusa acidaminophila]